MIVKDNNNGFESSGTQSTNQFTIKATSKAFKILSDGLYSNKIKSIIREISSNAYDAHVAAGKTDIPFYVKLPTKMDEIFKVRDYGIGLSEEDVINIYTTYFESTKTESNDYIGALGLGSKSPFSYIDTFNVTSYFNGTKYDYITSLINGVPSIILVNTQETEEENGLEVSFPVQENDFYKFENYAREVFQSFKLRPETNMNFDYTEYDNSIILEDKLFKIRKKSYGDSSLIAIQGNVTYPIDLSQIEIPKGITSLNRYGSEHKIEIEFEIGELDVSASRENLSYDSMTKTNIKNKLEKISKKLRLKALKEIKTQKTLFDAKMKLIELNKISFISDSLRNYRITYKASKLTTTEKIKLKDVKLKIFSTKGKKRGETISNEINENSFLNEKDTLFVIKDKRVSVTSEIQDIVYKKGYAKVVLIDNCQITLNRIETQIGKPLTTVLASEIKVKKSSTRKTYTVNSFGVFNYGRFLSINTNEIDNESIKYYLPTIRNTAYESFDSSREISVRNIKGLYERIFDKATPVIYAVRKSGIKDIEGDEKWINIVDLLKSEINKIRKFRVYKSIESGFNEGSKKHELFSLLNKKTNETLFKSQIDFAKKTNDEDIMEKVDILKIAISAGVIRSEVMEEKINYINNEDIFKDITNKYPLIAHVYNDLWGADIEVLSEELSIYINMKISKEEEGNYNKVA